jgi:hypothetical protein
MKEIENLQKELENHSPFLAKMKRNDSGFEVPKNYFKNLPDEIIGQLTTDNQPINSKKEAKTSWLTEVLDNLAWLLQPRPAMAFTSVLLLIFAGLFLLKTQKNTASSVSLADIPVEDLELYLSENIDEFDTETLVQSDENLFENGINSTDEMDAYFEEIIEETDLEDLL